MATIAKTVGSFDKVLAACNTIGARYQPNVPELEVAALAQLLERAQQSLGAATEARIAYRMAVNNRRESFQGIYKLAVRIVRTMSTSIRGESEHLDDAKLIVKKFRSPAKRQNAGEETQSTDGAVQVTRSSGRLSYDQQRETLSNLVELAGKVPVYNPVAPDLTLEGLTQKLDDLRATSQAVADTQAAYKKARLDRNLVLFGSDGVRGITRAVKNYILGTFGSDGPEAQQIAEVKM